MSTRLQIGQHAEQWACDFLIRKGLRLIERNVRTRASEIDLIMEDTSTLVFIEVRARRPTRHYASALQSISHQKQQKIILGAQDYLLRYTQLPLCRFDVLAIKLSSIDSLRPPADSAITWIKSAFELSDDGDI